MKIHIPNTAFLGNIDPFLRQFDPANPESLEITANKKWISIHPVVLVMLAALGASVDPAKINCEKFEAKSKHYLFRMGLFNYLRVPVDMAIVEHEPAGRFIPISQIRTSQELSTFIAHMVPLLHADPEPSKTMGYIISELARNVLEHADATNGAFLCAQYYKKSNSIRIGIADTGVGIRATIGRSYPVKTDLEALRLALQPGITGTTRREGGTDQNAGAGLFFIKSIAAVNRDFFVLYSGHALYKLLKAPAPKRFRLHSDPFEDRHSEEVALPYWTGTVVGADIALDKSAEFSSLIDTIGKTYGQAIRDRKRARILQPRFI